MLDVERWAELRREHFVRGVPIKELVPRTGLARNTVRGPCGRTSRLRFAVLSGLQSSIRSRRRSMTGCAGMPGWPGCACAS